MAEVAAEAFLVYLVPVVVVAAAAAGKTGSEGARTGFLVEKTFSPSAASD